MKGSFVDAPPDKVLVITRMLDAPRDLVYRVWTEPEHLMQWWGPKDWTTTSYSQDLRVGGQWRARISGPDGTAFWHEGVFREIVEGKRLVFSHAWVYDDGRRSIETEVRVTFSDAGARTKLTFEQGVFDTTLNRDNHAVGWNGCMDNLERYLSVRAGEAK